jgi:hypothetical protein
MLTVVGFTLAFAIAITGGLVMALGEFAGLDGSTVLAACALWLLSLAVAGVVAPRETLHTLGRVVRAIWNGAVEALTRPWCWPW